MSAVRHANFKDRFWRSKLTVKWRSLSKVVVRDFIPAVCDGLIPFTPARGQIPSKLPLQTSLSQAAPLEGKMRTGGAFRTAQLYSSVNDAPGS